MGLDKITPKVIVEQTGDYKSETIFVWVSYEDVDVEDIMSWDEFRYEAIENGTESERDYAEDDPYNVYCDYLKEFGFREVALEDMKWTVE